MKKMHTQLRRMRGFTLMEVIVAMVVIALLAGIAIPNYSAYINRSKRATAKSVLLDTANQLERNYTTFGCYNKAQVAACQTPAAAGNDVVLGSASPEGRASYALSANYADPVTGVITGQAFTLTTTPCGTAGTCAAGSDAFVDADCGSLTLTNRGVRGITGTVGTVATCWQR